MCYYDDNGNIGTGWILAVINFICFFAILITLEVYHKWTLRQEDSFTKVQTGMTSDEFAEKVASGSKYVVLDEFVLDMEKFIDHHPGGKWVIKKCIGRDVSKYFHGGYSFEGNLVG